jgi:hypothetical protein
LGSAALDDEVPLNETRRGPESDGSGLRGLLHRLDLFLHRLESSSEHGSGQQASTPSLISPCCNSMNCAGLLTAASACTHSARESQFPSGSPHSVDHAKGQYVYGAIHTQTIDGFWSILKRGVVGTFHKVSKKYLHLYVAEFQFRYNNRDNPDIFGSAIN